jgi:CheY-like chemotaxis protein
LAVAPTDDPVECRVVLVVEDEVLVRMNAESMIEDAGFCPVSAANADEAIAILEKRADILVVFSDIQMPGSIDGQRLALLVRDRWPPIAILLTSGFGKQLPQGLEDRAHFLPKPYTERDLTAALHRLAA